VSIFIQIFLLGAARLLYCYLFLQKGRFSRSRSSKVDKFGANQKRGVDFLLVRNSNFGPILHRFWARTRFMCYLPHPYSTLILGVFPLDQIAHVGVSQSIGLKLFGREIIFEEFQPMWSWYLIRWSSRTDGQTDRQTDDLLSHYRTLRLHRAVKTNEKHWKICIQHASVSSYNYT